MNSFELLKMEINNPVFKNLKSIGHILMYRGYREHYKDSSVIARSYAVANVFKGHKKHIYDNDVIIGSLLGRYVPEPAFSKAESDYASNITESYGRCNFHNNFDHYAPDFETVLDIGIEGIINSIRKSLEKYKGVAEKTEFLKGAEICMTAFSEMITQYADAAEEKSEKLPFPQKENLLKASQVCRKIALKKPDTFHEALQLVWMIHLSFLYEERFAMALGRMDQYLYPFYENDIEKGILDDEKTIELLSHTFYKIHERNVLPNEPGISDGSDVVNIAIGGLKRDGSDATNRLSSLIIEAVRRCNIAGPNLSARMHGNTPDWFWDDCLSLISTGIGYPALMNDEVTVPALESCGYDIEDCRDYSMVGCIEAFITGKQPPWADGRYNTPKYMELALNNGVCMQTGMRMGPETGNPEDFTCMHDFMDAFVKQMEYGMYETFLLFDNENQRYNMKRYAQPYLSCYCKDCIGRGKDINDSGSIYPSVYGMGCMGVATVADSLAAVEKVVFTDKEISLKELRDILITDFEGYEDIHKKLLSAPKYGNDDYFADKYAEWFVDIHAKLFENLRTKDGGRVYVAIASNVQNIPAGLLVSATPDGRKNKMPLSDAASPMRGADKNGLTSLILSTSRPDFKKVACGTVMNQKFDSLLLKNPESLEKVKSLLKIYFMRGGQEIQINAISKEMLIDAMDNPDGYHDLVVRISGFSAFYTKLDKNIQKDILERTEQR